MSATATVEVPQQLVTRESIGNWLPDAASIEAETLRRDLHKFVLAFWPVIEPGKPFIDGWHIKAICAHLEAVSNGTIKRLIINVPPRFSKSSLVSVLWQAWDWLQHSERRWLTTSHSNSLAVRDSRKMRLIIESPQYKDLIERTCPGFALAEDQNAKGHYENNYGGGRLASQVGSGLGEGGDGITIDDPLDASQYLSDAMRTTANVWYDEVLCTRLNDPEKSFIVIIMQRLHADDLTGHVRKVEPGRWDLLCLPCEYEGEDQVESSLGFCDPRAEVGELLCEERFGSQPVVDMKLRPFTWAGQYQQRPNPRGGGFFDVSKVIPIRNYDAKDVGMLCRYWDKAGTPGGGCATAGVKIARMRKGSVKFLVMDVVTGHWGAGDREARIRQVAAIDGRGCSIVVEQEPGSGGLESAQNTIRGLAGYRVRADKVGASKEARAEPFADQVAGGAVGVLVAGWTNKFLQELEQFPVGSEKDMVDAAAGAFSRLSKAGSGVGFIN